MGLSDPGNQTMTIIANKPAITVALSQLSISSLNLRADDGADSRIEDLARSLAPDAAGQLLPLFVKSLDHGTRFEVLDGRRRFLAWSNLAEAGLIGSNHLISVVVCETDDEIAQAVVIANDMRVEVQHADVLITINRLLSEHFTYEDMAKALGRDVKDVKRMTVLGQLDIRILQAFKAQRFRLATLRQIARIKDVEKLQAFAEMVEESEGPIHDYHIRELLEPGVYATDTLLNAFPLSTYLQKGGRVEQDLFEEHPDKLLDPEILGAAWKAAMKPVIKALKGAGLKVEFGLQAGYGAPDGFQSLGWNYPRTGDKALVAQLKAEAETIVGDLKLAAEASEHTRFVELAREFVLKALEAFTEDAKPLTPKACKASAGAHGHVKVEFYVDEAEYDALIEAHEQANPRKTYYPAPVISDTPLPKTNLRADVSLYGHLHHLKTTTIAGKALARSLAEVPMVALDVQLSTQFQQVVLGRTHDSGKYVVKVCASVRIEAIREPNPALEQPVIDRLKAYKALYEHSGLHPFEWVSSLGPSEKLDLLALITAAQVDMSELKTDCVRHAARAEAVLVSATIGHDFKHHLMVDADYYTGFSKKSLLALITKMGLDPEEFENQKRRQLAQTVYELALECDFVPPALNFHEDDYTVLEAVVEPEEGDEPEALDDSESFEASPVDVRSADAELEAAE